MASTPAPVTVSPTDPATAVAPDASKPKTPKRELKPLPDALKAYFPTLQRAMGYAAIRDFDSGLAEIRKLLRELEGDAKAAANEDVETLELLKAWMDEAGKVLAGMRRLEKVALEYQDRPARNIWVAIAHPANPLDVQALRIIVVEGSDTECEDMLSRIVEIAKPFRPKTLKVSQSEAESAAIWKGRKSAFGATGRISDYICMDGTIPTGRLPHVLRRIDEICKAEGLGVANVFHAGDGNLHPLVLFDINKPGEMEKAEQAGEEILKLCVEVGGCLTGEHGVGIEKRDLMRCQFSEADLRQQMRVRGVFDPLWLLNPAKVFPLDGRVAA